MERVTTNTKECIKEKKEKIEIEIKEEKKVKLIQGCNECKIWCDTA